MRPRSIPCSAASRRARGDASVRRAAGAPAGAGAPAARGGAGAETRANAPAEAGDSPSRKQCHEHAADRHRIALVRGVRAHHARNRRLDFDLGLVGLDCEDGLALADWLTGLLVPVNDFALAHRVSELGHLDRCRHWVAGAFVPAGRLRRLAGTN